VDAAVQEMFSAVHMQLLARACRLDKLLLVALLLEMRASGDPYPSPTQRGPRCTLQAAARGAAAGDARQRCPRAPQRLASCIGA